MVWKEEVDDEESALLDGGHEDDRGGHCHEGSQRVMEVLGEVRRGGGDSPG